jgi:hypothetical protein
MKLTWWILLPLALIAMGVGEWLLIGQIHVDLRRPGVVEERVAPYDIRISGDRLKTAVHDALASVNTARMARLDKALGDSVVVENVVYERNGGVVHADGRLRDLGGSRRVLAVMDAYDEDMTYLTSAAVPVQTAQGTVVSFSLAMPDRVDLSTLSFRVLNESDKSQINSLSERDLQKRRTDVQDRAVLLPDDAVFAIDLQEAEQRLRHLGYITAPEEVGVGEPAMKVIFNRFRKDHGLPPTNLLDVETFLAIRAVTADFKPAYQADL